MRVVRKPAVCRNRRMSFFGCTETPRKDTWSLCGGQYEKKRLETQHAAQVRRYNRSTYIVCSERCALLGRKANLLISPYVSSDGPRSAVRRRQPVARQRAAVLLSVLLATAILVVTFAPSHVELQRERIPSRFAFS